MIERSTPTQELQLRQLDLAFSRVFHSDRDPSVHCIVHIAGTVTISSSQDEI